MTKKGDYEKNNVNRPKVKADEALKKLFSLSKRPTLDLLNGLFNEQFKPETTEIFPKNTEYVSADLSVIFADWLMTVQEGDVSKQFHIEFQITNPASMIVRMFEYGFHAARDSSLTTGQKVTLRYPRQLVLYLERDQSVAEDISCIVEFPPYGENDTFEYKVPVKKFWDISVEELKTNLYALIPFNTFTSRKLMSDIAQDPRLTDEQKKNLIHDEFQKIKRVIQSGQEHLLALFREAKLTEDDLNNMSTVTTNLSYHLYEKFFEYYESFPREVEHMIESIIDPKVLKELKETRIRYEEEGRTRGMIQGRHEGRVEGKLESRVEDLLNILNARGFTQQNWVDRIKQEKDPDKLSKWVVLAATASSAQEIESALNENS